MSSPPFGQELALSERHNAHFLIVSVEEQALTSTNAPVFQAHLIHRILSGNSHLVIDLSAVESIDAAGLDAMRAALQATGPDGDVVLCGITESVMEALRDSFLNRVFGIFLGPEEAIEALT
jgi:anti-anti-sigma regulatory factor